MQIVIASLSTRRFSGSAAELVRLYVNRIGKYAPCSHRVFAGEATLLDFVSASAARTLPLLLITDSRGRQPTSEEFAREIEVVQDNGTQLLIVAVGPPDGWSPLALKRADQTIAFGRMTLPHELAAVVAAEQMYRALTILAGHPYHSGHAR